MSNKMTNNNSEDDKGTFFKSLDVTMDSQESSGKVYTLEEVKQHSTAEDIWMAIHNKVYDVTKFLEEHPGGVEVMLEHAGTEATYPFEDVGHSMDARDLLAQYYIGDVHDDDKTEKAAVAEGDDKGSSSNGMLMGLVVAAVAAGAFFMFSGRT